MKAPERGVFARSGWLRLTRPAKTVSIVKSRRRPSPVRIRITRAHVKDEDFTVADFACLRRADDGIRTQVSTMSSADHDFDFHFLAESRSMYSAPR